MKLQALLGLSLFCALVAGCSWESPVDDDPAEETAALRALLKQHNMTGAEAPGDIEWNFTKFLVDRNGNVAKRSGPKTTPAALAACIEALLSAK